MLLVGGILKIGAQIHVQAGRQIDLGARRQFVQGPDEIGLHAVLPPGVDIGRIGIARQQVIDFLGPGDGTGLAAVMGDGRIVDPGRQFRLVGAQIGQDHAPHVLAVAQGAGAGFGFG